MGMGAGKFGMLRELFESFGKTSAARAAAGANQGVRDSFKINAATALKNALPGGIKDAVMDYGMDAGMALLYASSVPEEYASGGERVGLGLEDMALGIGGSMLGRGLVTTALSPAMGRLKAGRVGQWLGGVGGGVTASMFGPRLYGGSLDARAQEKMQLEQSERDKQLIMQGMQMTGASHLGATAQYAATGVDPYDQLAIDVLGMS